MVKNASKVPITVIITTIKLIKDILNSQQLIQS